MRVGTGAWRAKGKHQELQRKDGGVQCLMGRLGLIIKRLSGEKGHERVDCGLIGTRRVELQSAPEL